MSLRDYELYRRLNELENWGEDFYALIMCAMANADDANQAKLRAAWPEVFEELAERYNTPAGLLVGEKSEDGAVERREKGLYENGRLVRAI